MQIQTFLALAGTASTWALSEVRSRLAVTLTPPHDKSKTNHVISRRPPTRAPSLGSLRRRVLVISKAELIVSDSEHEYLCIPSIFYINIYIPLNLF